MVESMRSQLCSHTFRHFADLLGNGAIILRKLIVDQYVPQSTALWKVMLIVWMSLRSLLFFFVQCLYQRQWSDDSEPKSYSEVTCSFFLSEMMKDGEGGYNSIDILPLPRGVVFLLFLLLRRRGLSRALNYHWKPAMVTLFSILGNWWPRHSSFPLRPWYLSWLYSPWAQWGHVKALAVCSPRRLPHP